MTYPKAQWTQCGVCREYGWSNTHRCPPQYECRNRNWDGDEWETVYAYNARDAAEKYVERVDNHAAEFTETCDIEVRNDGGEVECYEVTGEIVREYSASKKTTHEVETADDHS